MLKRVFLIIFGVLIMFPAACAFFDVLPSLNLTGVQSRKQGSNIKISDILSQRLVPKVERVLKAKNPLYPYLVRTANQLNYSVFRQLGDSAGGSKGAMANSEAPNLFEIAYSESVNQQRVNKPARTQRKVSAFSKFNAEMTAQGGEVLVVINPNKISLNPELLPNSFRISPQDSQPQSNYQTLISQLANTQLKVLDLQAEFSANRPRQALPIFPPGGTHLSEYGTCLAVQKLVAKLDLGQILCTVKDTKSRPIDQDLDLAQLANLWSINDFTRPVPRTKTTYTPQKATPPKTALFIGTSFIWNIRHSLIKQKVFKNLQFLFYNKTKHLQSGDFKRNFKCNAKTYQNYLKSFDYVILEVNHAFADQLGYGFAKCIDKLKQDDQTAKQ